LDKCFRRTSAFDGLLLSSDFAGGSVTHAGALLAAGLPLTRFGVFKAGMASARDPNYTAVPPRERMIKARQDAGSVVR
jgi:hypothetical protein